jgi:carbon monoxide dehydrogenase subunit G
MKIEGSYAMKAPRAQVFESLTDPETLAATLPGVRSLEVTGPDSYELLIDVGVGAVKGSYRGTFSIRDRKEPESLTLEGTARGGPGSASVTAQAALSENEGGGTVFAYEADARVTGALAGVGQRMIAAAAKRTTTQFLSALDEAILAPRAPSAEKAEPAAAVPETGRVFTAPGRRREAPDRFIQGVLVGFLLAIAGVLVGRFTARK